MSFPPDSTPAGTTQELAMLDLSHGSILEALQSPEAQLVSVETLPSFLPRQRWFGAKDSTIKSVALRPVGELVPGHHALAAADVTVAAETQRYLLPISALWAEDIDTGATSLTPVLARLKLGERAGVLIDSALAPNLAIALMEGMVAGRTIHSDAGEVLFEATEGLAEVGDLGRPRHLGAEQSNVSIAFGSKVILKLYRRLRSGDQPDVGVARFLTEIGKYAHTPQFLGQIRHLASPSGSTTLAAAFAFVPNQGDVWTVVTEALFEDLKRHGLAGQSTPFGAQLQIGKLLGQRTAELHRALATPTENPAFSVEPLTRADVLVWTSDAIVEATAVLDQLQELLPGLASGAKPLASYVLERRNQLIELLGACAGMEPSGGRSRIHGDYHLGQVLATEGDFMIIDFEGEPRRSLKERQAKSSPVRDVAGMLRSFHYAAWTAIDRYRGLTGSNDVLDRAEAWRQQASADFISAYDEHIAGVHSYPRNPAFARALTEMFLLQKAIYEVGYELANRPDWVEIPLSGIHELLKNT